MLWIFPAIGAHFVWALVNVSDKYIVSNRVRNPFGYMIWYILLGSIDVAIIPFIPFFVPEWHIFFWIIVASVVYFIANLLYIYVMSREDVTRLNIWWGLVPFFNLIIAWVVINERLGTRELIALAFLMGAGVIGAVKRQGNLFRISRAFWWMVVACFLFSSNAVILRYATQQIPFSTVFIWESMLMSAMAIPFLFFGRFRNIGIIGPRSMYPVLFAIFMGIVLLDRIGVFLGTLAFSLGPAALVSAVESFQVFFVFLIAIGLSLKNPQLLREAFDRENLAFKLIALVLMITGIYLVYL